MYFALVIGITFRIKRRFGKGELLGSCGDLEGGSVISIMYLGTKVDVLHGGCKSRQ